jgi:hypothetical protein
MIDKRLKTDEPALSTPPAKVRLKNGLTCYFDLIRDVFSVTNEARFT